MMLPAATRTSQSSVACSWALSTNNFALCSFLADKAWKLFLDNFWFLDDLAFDMAFPTRFWVIQALFEQNNSEKG
jgi:hypothetical protein